MQAVLQFFDMPLKAMGTDGPQKIAIKMPKPKTPMDTGDENGFMAVMDALMALTPEQLQASLKDLDWVPIEEGAEVLAPLIDLSIMDRGAMEGSRFFNPSDPNTTPPLLTGQETTPDPANVDDVLQQEGIQVPCFLQMTQAGSVAADAKTAVDVPLETQLTEKAQNAFALHDARDQSASKVHSDIFTEKGVRPDTAEPLLQKDVAALKKEMATDGFAKDASTVKEPMIAETGTGLKTAAVTGDLKNPGPEFETQMPEIYRKAAVAPKGVAPMQPDAGTVPVETDEPRPFTEVRPKVGMDEKTAKERVPQFNGQAGPVAADGDHLANAAQPAKTVPIKEMVRRQVHHSTVQSELDQVVEETHKVRQNSSTKDASLSFTSRWAGMVEPGEENMTEARASENTPSKTDAHDVIRQMVQRMTLKRSRFQSQMNIKLKPEFLGNVRMQISTDHHQVAVRMMADSNVVKEMLEQNIQFLRSELVQHGLEIDKFDVFVGSDNEDWQNEQQAHWQQRSKQGEPQPFWETDDGQPDTKENATPSHLLGAPALKRENEIDYFA